MSIEDRFYAAVNVINGLPRHGPYQPSNEMKLSFYAFYKQATEGPNTDTKPWSWEVVKKSKWDAWKKLGEMSREEAMTRYVDELNKIVETMSYTENVADFLKSMDDSNSDKDITVNSKDFKKSSVVPPINPLPPASDDDSPIKISSTIKEESVDEDEDELYTDSVDSNIFNNSSEISESTVVVSNGYWKKDNAAVHQECTTDILMRTVLTLRTDLNEITGTVRKIEQKLKSLTRRNGLFRGLSNQTVSFIILWPIVSNMILVWLYYRRRLHSLR